MEKRDHKFRNITLYQLQLDIQLNKLVRKVDEKKMMGDTVACHWHWVGRGNKEFEFCQNRIAWQATEQFFKSRFLDLMKFDSL